MTRDEAEAIEETVKARAASLLYHGALEIRLNETDFMALFMMDELNCVGYKRPDGLNHIVWFEYYGLRVVRGDFETGAN